MAADLAGRGRVALVTGGAQGIGKAIAHRLVGDGYYVALLDRDRDTGARTEKDLATIGAAIFIPGDVAREADVKRAVSRAVRRFGRLDALVNNAGFGIWKPLEALSLAEWNAVLATNLTGAFLCAKHAAPHLRAVGGAIVNIASTRALMSEPNGEAYGASKGGLVTLTHALANSLGPEVRVNCVSPGWIDVSGDSKKGGAKPARLSRADHAQHPAGRVGRPEDIAAMVAYLLGPEAGFMTDANFVVDGGMTRKMIYV